MLTRREALAGLLSGVLPAAAPAAEPKPGEQLWAWEDDSIGVPSAPESIDAVPWPGTGTPMARVYRLEKDGVWRETHYNDLIEGDRIVTIGVSDGELWLMRFTEVKRAALQPNGEPETYARATLNMVNGKNAVPVHRLLDEELKRRADGTSLSYLTGDPAPP